LLHFHGPKPLDFDGDGLLPEGSAQVYKNLHARAPNYYKDAIALWTTLLKTSTHITDPQR